MPGVMRALSIAWRTFSTVAPCLPITIPGRAGDYAALPDDLPPALVGGIRFTIAGLVVAAAASATATRTWPGLAPACRESRDAAVSSVSVDDVAGGRLAVEHLIGLGHREIRHISGPLTAMDAVAFVVGNDEGDDFSENGSNDDLAGIAKAEEV